MSLPNSADPGRYNVRIQQFTIAYDGANPVLNIPYLELVSGSYTLITGPTGCGKSSLAHALVGVLEDMTTARVAGSISMNGNQLATLDSAQRSGTIAAVWQRPETQLFASTVLAEVRAGLDFQLIAPNEATFRARRALHLVGLSHIDESRNPLTLSGGEQQRLALASALVLRAPILVLDEVASQLDRTASHRLGKIIREIRSARQLTVVAFDHRPDPHLEHTDRVIVLDENGRIALDDKPASVYGENVDFCRRIGVHLPAKETSSSDTDFGALTVHQTAPGLTTQALTVARRSALLLRDATLTLPRGAIALLLGPNGAGKTSLLDALAGEKRGVRGHIDPSRRVRLTRGIGYLPQRGSELMFAHTVRTELHLALPPGARSSAAEIDDMLNRAGLLCLAEVHPQHLSGGQRQRLSVLLAVAGRPAFLLLDEPTNAQDVTGTAQIRALLAGNAQDRVAVIATHDAGSFRGIATHHIELQTGIVKGVWQI